MVKKKVKRALQWRKDEVVKLRDLIADYSTIGVAKFRGLGSNQLQRIRKDFRDKALLRVSKNSMLELSFTECGMGKMSEYIEDQMALIFTNYDSFQLYSVLEKGKIPAPIKAGATAPFDIVVEAGPTSLRPGPIVGELQSRGIPAGIESGKVVIKQRKVAVKGGDVVSAPMAELLAKLEIHPVKEGLDLLAVFDRDGNVLFTPEVLHIDVDKYLADVQEGVKAAFSLATHLKYSYPTRFTIIDLLYEASDKARNVGFNAAYPTAETIKPLLQKAFSEARNLAINAEVYTKETMPDLLVKAGGDAQKLKTVVGE